MKLNIKEEFIQYIKEQENVVYKYMAEDIYKIKTNGKTSLYEKQRQIKEIFDFIYSPTIQIIIGENAKNPLFIEVDKKNELDILDKLDKLQFEDLIENYCNKDENYKKYKKYKKINKNKYQIKKVLNNFNIQFT